MLPLMGTQLVELSGGFSLALRWTIGCEVSIVHFLDFILRFYFRTKDLSMCYTCDSIGAWVFVFI